MTKSTFAKIGAALIAPLAALDFRYALKTGTAITLPFMVLFGYREGFLCTEALVGTVTLFGVAACLMGEVSGRQWRQFFSLPVVWVLLGFLALLYFQAFFRVGMGYHLGELLLPIGHLAAACWLFFYLQDRKNLELFASVMVKVFLALATLFLLAAALRYAIVSKLSFGADWWRAALPFFTPFLTVNSLAAPTLGAPIFLACLYWRRLSSGGKVSEGFKYSTIVTLFAGLWFIARTAAATGNYGPVLPLIGLSSAALFYLLRIAYGKWVSVVITLIVVVALPLALYDWFSGLSLDDLTGTTQAGEYKELGPNRGRIWDCAIFNAFQDPLALQIPLGLFDLCSWYVNFGGHGYFFMLLSAGGWVLVSLLILTVLTFTFYWLSMAHRPYVWLVFCALGIFVGILPVMLSWRVNLGIDVFFGAGVYFLAIISALVLAINRELGSPLKTVFENGAGERAS